MPNQQNGVGIPLSLEDINEVIRHFALEIQIRTEELASLGIGQKAVKEHQGSTRQSGSSTQENVKLIIEKYENLQVEKESEKKLIKKFFERVIQILEFYKKKSQRQNILATLINKVRLRLDRFCTPFNRNVGKALRFVYLLSKQGLLLHRQFGSRKSTHRSIVKLKAEDSKRNSQNPIQDAESLVKIRPITPKTQTRKISILKDNYLNNSSLNHNSKIGVEPSQKIDMSSTVEARKMTRSFTVENISSQCRLRPSSSSFSKAKRSAPQNSKRSHRIIRRDTHFDRPIQQSQTHPQNVPYLNNSQKSYLQKACFKKQGGNVEVNLSQLYVGMNIDKNYILKNICNKKKIDVSVDFLVKDMEKRNQSIFRAIKKEEKKYLSSKTMRRTQTKCPFSNVYSNLTTNALSECKRFQQNILSKNESGLGRSEKADRVSGFEVNGDTEQIPADHKCFKQMIMCNFHANKRGTSANKSRVLKRKAKFTQHQAAQKSNLSNKENIIF